MSDLVERIQMLFGEAVYLSTEQQKCLEDIVFTLSPPQDDEAATKYNWKAAQEWFTRTAAYLARDMNFDPAAKPMRKMAQLALESRINQLPDQ